MVLVDHRHQRSRREQGVALEHVDTLLRGELDPLADDVDKVADAQVAGDQELLLVEVGQVALGRPLDDDRHAIRILVPDLFRLGLASLEGELLLE